MSTMLEKAPKPVFGIVWEPPDAADSQGGKKAEFPQKAFHVIPVGSPDVAEKRNTPQIASAYTYQADDWQVEKRLFALFSRKNNHGTGARASGSARPVSGEGIA